MNKEAEILDKYAKNLVFVSLKCCKAILSVNDELKLDEKKFKECSTKTYFSVLNEYCFYLRFETHTCLLNIMETKIANEKLWKIWSHTTNYIFNLFYHPTRFKLNEESLPRELFSQYQLRIDAFVSSEERQDDSLLANSNYVFGKFVGSASGHEDCAIICYLASSLAPNALKELEMNKLVEFYKE